MIQTNLLGKHVKLWTQEFGKLKSITGEICAIYQHDNELFTYVLTSDGEYKCQPLCQFSSIDEKAKYQVSLFYSQEQKIKAIKLTREILYIGLKEAKELADQGCGKIKIKDYITHKAAHVIGEMIRANGMEAQIEEMINGS